MDDSHEQGKDIVVLVDSNNVRGKTDFEWTNRDLLKLLREWKGTKKRTKPKTNLQIVCVMDHGLQSQLFPYDFGLLVLAGPHRTADDVIATATKWLTIEDNNSNYSNSTPNVFVVTSDRELKRRCLQNNRPGSLKKKKRQPQRDFVKVFDSPAFIRTLEAMRVDLDADTEDEKATTAGVIEGQSLLLEEEIRRFGFSRPPWSCQSERKLAIEQGPWYSQVLQTTKQTNTTALHLQRQVFNEKTWHRVLFAENIRRTMAAMKITKEATINTTGPLGDYQRRFQMAAGEGEKVNTMFLDHRIQFDTFQQQALLYYLDQAVDSTTKSANSPSLSETETDQTTVAADSCTEFLRKLVVQSYPEVTEEDLLNQYREQAPSRLQLCQPSDLYNLLQLVALRAESQSYKQWTLRSADYDDKIRPRRRGKRSMGRYRMVVDEMLVEFGQTMESRWFELLEYR